jgi:glycosyltransferase involved in cell wall biosynthesis
LTIALDATYGVGRELSGVGVYSGEILRGLALARPEDRFLWCFRPHRLAAGWRMERPPNSSVRPLLEGFQFWRAGLFHGLNQRLPRRAPGRTVCTFHDLFVLTGEYSTPQFRARFAGQARAAAGRADAIIAVSTFTADQVEALLGVERARIHVVPHGVRMGSGARDQERLPAVLHAGAIQTRKNIVRLVEAFERAAGPPWRLILAGGDGFGAAAIRERIAASPARGRIDILGWVDHRTLQELYRTSSVLAFPSLDEGFGIPVLEAMASGLPVLTSNRPALAEVAGGAAVLADPLDGESIAAGLRSLIQDPSLRDVYRERGRQRAAAYTWEAAAARTWRVYETLLR